MSRHRALPVAAVAAGVLVLLAGVGVVALAALSDRIRGTSMEPTLHDGDRVLVTPGSKDAVHRFDVVIAHEPGSPGVQIVKRVLAVPGDRVEIRGGSAADVQVLVQPGGRGRWYRADEPAWRGRWTGPAPCCDPDGTGSAHPAAQSVPAGRYFLLGDNPGVSVDSRIFGWVPAGALVGRVGWRVWPLSAGRAVGNRARLVPVGTSPEPGGGSTSS